MDARVEGQAVDQSCLPERSKNRNRLARRRASLLVRIALVCALSGGPAPPASEELIYRQPIDRIEEVITRDHARIDFINTADKRGALRIEARSPMEVDLFRLDRLDFDNARLFYRAKMRVGALKGEAYLVLRCRLGNSQNEVVAEGLQYALSGTTDWVDAELVLYLHTQERPRDLRFQVRIAGKGVVWVDDVRVYRAPLIEPSSN